MRQLALSKKVAKAAFLNITDVDRVIDFLRKDEAARSEFITFCQRPDVSEPAEVVPLNFAEKIELTNFMLAFKGSVEIACEYKNWRGHVATRRFRPLAFWYGSSEFHPKPGLMLKAIDLDKNEERDFRVSDFKTPLQIIEKATASSERT